MGYSHSPGDGSGSEGSVGEAVVAAVAELEGVEEHELSEPLHDVVDTEALDALFRSGPGRVRFDYLGYVVTVDHERRVDVRRPDDF